VQNLAIDARRSTIVAAGRLAKDKGFDLMIRAWSQIAGAWPDWTVELYGAGPERAALEALIAEQHLAGRVLLKGATSDLAAVMEHAGVFVLSSRFEGLGMVLIEAMAAGCPVISFDCPRGPGEIVRDQVDGILVPAEDVAKLAAAIERLLGSPRLRTKYSLAAKESARFYDPTSVGARWDALLGPTRPGLEAKAVIG
jgi:glycosyltransferase involved in cell wall biosynthesis